MDFEQLKIAEVVIGLVVTLFGSGAGVIFWMSRRIRTTAEQVVTGIGVKQDQSAVRVSALERKVDGIDNDVLDISRRLTEVERSMETVARAADVNRLEVKMANFEGSVFAQLKSLSGMMHTFRESALRSSEKGKSNE